MGKKMKGFRKDHLLCRANFMRQNGADDWSIVSFLCQQGMSKTAAFRVVENLAQPEVSK